MFKQCPKTGKYVRVILGKPVKVKSNAKGNSLSKFPRQLGKIGYHKWA